MAPLRRERTLKGGAVVTRRPVDVTSLRERIDAALEATAEASRLRAASWDAVLRWQERLASRRGASPDAEERYQRSMAASAVPDLTVTEAAALAGIRLRDLTVSEVAALEQKTPGTIRRALRLDRLAGFKECDGRWRVTVEGYLAWRERWAA